MLKIITFELLQQFRYYLKNEERENSTIEKYLQNIQSFAN